MNHVDHRPLIHWHCCGRLLLLLGMLLLSLGGVAWPGAPATAATATLQGAPQVVGVLSGTAQFTLRVSATSLALHQPVVLTATLESFAGPLTGSVTFQEGSQMLSSTVLRNGGARVTVAAPSSGVHLYSAVYHGSHSLLLATPRVAVIIGRATPALLATNQKLTVVGGRTAPCDQAANARGAFQPGCEVITGHWLPGAKVVYSIGYPDGSSQAYTATTNSAGNVQHAFGVVYKPAPHTAHGDAPTVAWITMLATSRDGVQAASASLRFSVIAPVEMPTETATTTSIPSATPAPSGTPPPAISTATAQPPSPTASNTSSPAPTNTASPQATSTASATTYVPPAPPAPPAATATTPPAPTATTPPAPTATTPPAATPVVTSLTPPNGPPGGNSLVEIAGSNFTMGSTVSFGSTAATFVLFQSAGELLAAAPPGAFGTVDVTVTTPAGTSAVTNADQFTYEYAFNPPSGWWAMLGGLGLEA